MSESLVVGVVDLGAMGGPIAGHVMRAGMPVVVSDLDETAVAACVAAGMSAATDLVDLARRRDVVLVVVATDDQVVTELSDAALPARRQPARRSTPVALTVGGFGADPRRGGVPVLSRCRQGVHGRVRPRLRRTCRSPLRRRASTPAP